MKIRLLLLVLLMVTKVVAQKSLARVEREDKYEYSYVHSMGKAGVLWECIGENRENGKVDLKYEFFSTDLKTVYADSIKIPKRSERISRYTDKDKGINYSMYKTKRDKFSIVMHNIHTKITNVVEGEYDDDFYLSEMKVMNNKAIFSATKSKESKIIIIDLSTGKLTDVPFKIDKFRRKDIDIQDFQVFDNEILVFITGQVNKRTKNLYAAKVNFDGVQEDFYPLAENQEEKFITISATKNNNSYIITGTYAKGKSELSQGIYLGQIENKRLSFLKFYNFLDLQNFTNFMSEKERRKVERRKENSQERGYELLINYSMIVHPIKEVAGGYEFVGEAYYPVYGSCGRGCVTFLGYQYTHAVIAKFSKTGNIVWSNTFEIKPDKSSLLPLYKRRYVRTNENKKNVNAVIVYDERIDTKSFDATNGKELSSNSSVLPTQYENDKVKDGFSNTEYWYDQNYLVFGYQKIVNKEVKRPRKVLFINKIQVK